MALSSPESPVPPRRVFINRVENPSEEHEELNKMAHGVVAESRRFVLLVKPANINSQLSDRCPANLAF